MNLSAKWTGPMSRWKQAGLTLLLGLFAPVLLPAQVSREYDVKAAFLYNFITFTEWPATAFGSANSPYVIGVLGVDPFGSAIDQIVNGAQIKGRPLVVRRFTRVEDMHRCHILFISASESRRMPEILRQIHGEPILTVADSPRFAEAGGCIGFIVTDRVRLVINPKAVTAGRLTMSSKLLKLASLVSDGGAMP